MQDPQPDFRPLPGVPEPLSALVRRILAPNASPMTYRGTNTYLVGTRDIAVIDPGPQDAVHLEAILAAVQPGQRITHILVTHAHLDHAPLAPRLSQQTGAPVHAFGPAEAGRRPVMQTLAASGAVGGGEGVDQSFAPDVCLEDEAILSGSDWTLRALHLPGHMAHHMGFALDGALFSGDMVMGWASSLVSPPDGDLTAFMASLTRLSAEPWQIFYPGHGAPVTDPATRVKDLSDHRLMRGAQIAEALSQGPATAAQLAARIYTDTPPALLPAAERNVLAHLLDMTETGHAAPQGALHQNAVFHVV